MDQRVQAEVAEQWRQVVEREYDILEVAERSLRVRQPTLLDVGCGARGILGRLGDRLAALEQRSLGVDLDRAALAQNQSVGHKACASCYSLPVKSNSVDIVVSRWLFEHLEHPELAMREFARVLRPGGFLYIKTPNLLNYTMLVSWATPVAVHNALRSANGQSDNIPTFYRANTKGRLAQLAGDSGFTVRRIESYSYSFMYYGFNKELFLTMRAASRLVGRFSGNLQQTLLGLFEKRQET